MKSARFLVVDGIDGCGKSTQTALLNKQISEVVGHCLATSDPATTPLAQVVRGLVCEHHTDAATTVGLISAARGHNWKKFQKVCREVSVNVVSDRWVSTDFAYHAYEVGYKEIMMLHQFACRETALPDAFIILDLPVDVAQARLRASGKVLDRFDNDDISVQEVRRQAYLAYEKMLAVMPKPRPAFYIVDAQASVADVHASIWNCVEHFFVDKPALLNSDIDVDAHEAPFHQEQSVTDKYYHQKA